MIKHALFDAGHDPETLVVHDGRYKRQISLEFYRNGKVNLILIDQDMKRVELLVVPESEG
jgi:hypothetical protein